jgi:hypothetical protein
MLVKITMIVEVGVPAVVSVVIMDMVSPTMRGQPLVT